MHAYLIIGKDTVSAEENLIKKLNGFNFEFPLSKIEEVRQLSAFLRNTQAENTIIVVRNIDRATVESLNAFLKNLEEPQKNVNFILTAQNEYKVLPTILSRCQVIRVTSEISDKENTDANEFLETSTANRLIIVDKIKGRPDAVQFLQSLLDKLHNTVNHNLENYLQRGFQLENVQATLNAINENGNVNLQLTSLVVNLDAGQKNSD